MFGPKFQVEGDVSHSPCSKTRCTDHGIRIWAKVSFIFVTIHASHGQIDGDGFIIANTVLA